MNLVCLAVGSMLLTIVSTREMTSYGKWCVEYILRGLKDENVVVVSGLARGIDACVHSNCLNLGIPTIAVVAGGLNTGYPKSNQILYDRISEEGLVISEFPSETKIVKGMFPLRNRILAGISLATIVIESGEVGGSLITARLALEAGREIFCIPCSIRRFAIQGCNIFLDQGATPLLNPAQIIDFLKYKR